MFNAWILVIGLILWGLQYLFAWAHEWLTPAEMQRQFPGQSVLPLIWHGGIWYDLPLTFWLAWLANRHPEWTWWQWCITLALGFAGSLYMHRYVYAPATLPNFDKEVVVTQEAHVQNGQVTFVGDLHTLFFGIMLAVILNEVLFSTDPAPAELWATAVFLVGLLIVGNHMVLGLIKILTHRAVQYRGKPLKSVTGWVTVSGCTAVAILVCVARIDYHFW